MSKNSTEFSQISLLSNQKAKLIILKNSIQKNEHVKLCRSLEQAKRGIKATHGKKKKDLEKRLERHVQDSLNIDDIKSLRKYVGDVRGESHFESGRKRSSSLLHQKKSFFSASELSKLETRSCLDSGEDCGTSQVRTKTYFTNHMPHWEEKDFNSNRFARSEDICNNSHSKACPGAATTDAQSKSGPPKVQRTIVANKQNKTEMLSGLPNNSAKLDKVHSRTTKDNLIGNSRAIIIAEVSACENLDENNNLGLEDVNSVDFNVGKRLKSETIDYDNQDKRDSDTNTRTDLNQNSTNEETSERNECKRNTFGKSICEQRQDLKKGVAIRKRLGPTPKECDEDGAIMQDEDSTEGHYPVETNTSLNQVDERTSTEKQREIMPQTTSTQTRRRRSSWAGRSTTERLLKRSDSNERLMSRVSVTSNAAGNDVMRTGLVDINWNKESQKPCVSKSDISDCASTAGECLTTERRLDRENFEGFQAEKKKNDAALHKSHSVPMGLETLTQPRPKMYSEEPFYIRPRRLSRRISWQSTKLTAETLKGLQEIADKAKHDKEATIDEPETPLVSILPPITLQSIYAQQSSKEKREHEQQERRQRSTQKKKGEGKSLDSTALTDRLRDCRYLRPLKKDANL